MIEKVAKWMIESKKTVVLTGAGMSTESGIPDFRSQNGAWKTFNPAKVASAKAIERHYEAFWAFYAKRVCDLEGLEPNEGHKTLAEMEKEGLIGAVVTQNVDGFHQKAGSANVLEIHGNIYSFRCAGCKRESSRESFLAKEACGGCGGKKLRPNVVLFDEALPKEALEAAREAMREADLVIVIGTSLKVFPASQLPKLSKGRTVFINMEKPKGWLAPKFDAFLQGKASETLRRLKNEIEKSRIF